MFNLQDIIHKVEVAGDLRFLRIPLIALGILLVMAAYNWRAYRNMSTQEAMDSAQLARNIAQGKGYSTLFVRPFSMHLLKRHNKEKGMTAAPGKPADAAQILDRHPDLANPPLYPIILAGLMKVLPFDYTVSTTKPFWSVG
jgi:hypothetical protein